MSRAITPTCLRCESQLLLVDGFSALRAPRVRAFVSFAEPVLAGSMGLGLEQGRVGVLQQRFRIGTVTGVHADSDADCDLHIALGYAVRCAHGREDLLRAQGRIIRAGDFPEQNQEFIPTLTTDRV